MMFQPEASRLPGRGAAPEQGDGHHLDIQRRILLVQIQQLVELLQEGQRLAALAKQGGGRSRQT